MPFLKVNKTLKSERFRNEEETSYAASGLFTVCEGTFFKVLIIRPLDGARLLLQYCDTHNKFGSMAQSENFFRY